MTAMTYIAESAEKSTRGKKNTVSHWYCYKDFVLRRKLYCAHYLAALVDSIFRVPSITGWTILETVRKWGIFENCDGVYAPDDFWDAFDISLFRRTYGAESTENCR